jgi:hypothetical protein
VIPGIAIRRAANRMLKRYDNKAIEESTGAPTNWRPLR